MAAGSFTLIEELFAAGAAEFVDELRRVHHAERLGDFAAKWFNDKRSIARQFLIDYLDQPLNCYRHEALVKRLFKLAEKSGDDELMGAFLVAFDRSVRHVRRDVSRWKSEHFVTKSQADNAYAEWIAQGYGGGAVNPAGQRFYAFATKTEEIEIVPANTKMPRPAKAYQKRDMPLEDRQRAKYERRYLLFSVPTRRYLRRRAWRYFRKLGKTDPSRYLRAVGQFLRRYRDDDIDSPVRLLDNWGLMNALFRGCQALAFSARGCKFRDGNSIAHLGPAPRFQAAWVANPDAIHALMLEANCRTVRHWAVEMLRAHCRDWLKQLPVPRLLGFLDSPDPDVVALGLELLESAPNLDAVPVEQWLRHLESDDLDKLTKLCEFLKRKLDPQRVSSESALELAKHRSRPVAELGFEIIKTKTWTQPETLMSLTNTECETVRMEILPWLKDQLSSSSIPRRIWLQEWFDSRYEDVRSAAWKICEEKIVQEGHELLIRLMESPYDDVRIRLVDFCEIPEIRDSNTIVGLWASVLTNIHRGGRQKPGVVASIVKRIQHHAGETDALLPLLAIAVRSLRGPEFRAGLAGVVQLSNHSPDLHAKLRGQFPELTLGG